MSSKPFRLQIVFTKPVASCNKKVRQGLNRLRENWDYEISPEGKAELSPGRQSWVGFEKGEPVPQGRLKMDRHAVLLQSSLRDSIMFTRCTQDCVLG